MSKKTIIIILILVAAVGAFAFFYYRNTIFSKQILRIEILGADKAKAGEEIEYTVRYKNNGNFALENPVLTFELPSNSLTEDGKLRITQNLKDIYPGGEDFLKVKARLLGREGDLKVARAYLSYAPHNLSARYESDTTFTTTIDTVPITLTFDLPSKVEKGKELTYTINYFSNIPYPLENLSIKVEPLDGFNIVSAEPSSLDKTEWKLDVLNKSEGGRIKITGRVSANQDSRLNFMARLGMWQDGVFVVVKEANQEVEVIQPLLFISQQVNGASNYIASPGEKLEYQVFFRNIGSTSFENIFAIVTLDESVFNFQSLESRDGTVRSHDGLVIFDSKELLQLRRVNPNQEVKASFKVQLKDVWPVVDADKNNMYAKNKVEVFDISQEFSVKVNSKLALTQSAYYSATDGINNSGPLPPVVGQTTTYTVRWQVKNLFNDVKNIKIKAVLAQNVFLADAISPETEASHFSFDSGSREIVWKVGNLNAGSEAVLSFQVAFTPDSSQRGTVPNIIGQATVFGEDQFTGATIQNKASQVTTNLPDDRGNLDKGVVQ